MSVIYEKVTLTVATPYYGDQEKSHVSAVDSILAVMIEAKHEVILIDWDAEKFELTPLKQEEGDA